MWTQDIRGFFHIKGNWKMTMAMFMYGIAQGILKPINAIYLQNQVHLSKIEITILMSITLIIDMTITYVVGLYSDRLIHKKKLPIAASLLCMIGVLWYIHVTSFQTALFAAILVTSPAGVIMGQLFAMARSHYTLESPKNTEMAVVWLRTTFSLGFFAGLLTGSELFTFISFHGVLWGNLVCYVILFSSLLLYRERTGSVAVQNSPNAVSVDKLMLLALLIVLCGDAIRGLYFPLVVNHLFHNPALVSQLWSLQAIFELLWMTVAGYLATRYGSIRVIRYSILCGMTAYAVYAFHPTLLFLILAQPVHSFYVSTLYSVGMGYVQRMFLHRTGFGASLYMVLTQFASLIGYFVPNLVPGFSPTIFVIPLSLSFCSFVLLILAKGRRA